MIKKTDFKLFLDISKYFSYLSNLPLTFDSNIIASFATEFGGITCDNGDV